MSSAYTYIHDFPDRRVCMYIYKIVYTRNPEPYPEPVYPFVYPEPCPEPYPEDTLAGGRAGRQAGRQAGGQAGGRYTTYINTRAVLL